MNEIIISGDNGGGDVAAWIALGLFSRLRHNETSIGFIPKGLTEFVPPV